MSWYSPPEKKWMRITRHLNPYGEMKTVDGDIPIREWMDRQQASLEDGSTWEKTEVREDGFGNLAVWGLPGPHYEDLEIAEKDEDARTEDKLRRAQRIREKMAQKVVDLKWLKEPDLWLHILRMAVHLQEVKTGRSSNRSYLSRVLDNPFIDAFFGQTTRFVHVRGSPKQRGYGEVYRRGLNWNFRTDMETPGAFGNEARGGDRGDNEEDDIGKDP